MLRACVGLWMSPYVRWRGRSNRVMLCVAVCQVVWSVEQGHALWVQQYLCKDTGHEIFLLAYMYFFFQENLDLFIMPLHTCIW